MGISPACTSAQARGGHWFPTAGAADGKELPTRFVLRSLEEQQVPLSIEPSFQSLFAVYHYL